MSQSTNDSYPTAIKVAFLLRNDKLIDELKKLVASFRAKGDAYLEVVKMGRTELQDAVPMTVGQEFHAFAASLESEIQLLREAEKCALRRQHGRDRDRHRASTCRRATPRSAPRSWRSSTGKPIVPATDMLAATWDQQGFVVYSSALKSVAIKLSKIASDLILLTSGPRAGLARSTCRRMQPGSSIMPGKVNPVIPEVDEHRRLPRDGQRLRRDARRAQRAAAAQRLRAGRGAGDDGVAAACSTTRRSASAPSASTASRSTRRCWRTTWRRPSASSPRSIRCWATRRRPSWPPRPTKSGKGILEIIREKKALTEEQIKDLLDPVKLTESRQEPSTGKK